MTCATIHVWPTLYEGRSLPAGSVTQQGTLLVPLHLPAGSLAHMEQEYRLQLWPRVQPGYVRYFRRFAWGDPWHRILHFQICDCPTVRASGETQVEDEEDILDGVHP